MDFPRRRTADRGNCTGLYSATQGCKVYCTVKGWSSYIREDSSSTKQDQEEGKWTTAELHLLSRSSVCCVFHNTVQQVCVHWPVYASLSIIISRQHHQVIKPIRVRAHSLWLITADSNPAALWIRNHVGVVMNNNSNDQSINRLLFCLCIIRKYWSVNQIPQQNTNMFSYGSNH